MRITNASLVSAVAAALPSNSGRRGNLRGGNNSRDNRDNRDRRDNNPRAGRNAGAGKKESRPKPSQQDLDAEMDSYMGSANNEDIQMN